MGGHVWPGCAANHVFGDEPEFLREMKMKTKDLIAKYSAFHGYAHASRLAASVTKDVCYVPENSVGQADDGPGGGGRAVPESGAASVCYVP